MPGPLGTAKAAGTAGAAGAAGAAGVSRVAGVAGVAGAAGVRVRSLDAAVGAGRRWAGRFRGRVGPGAWVLAAGAAVALVGRSPVPVLLAALAVPLARRTGDARARRIAAERRADEVIALCGALVGEVRAGHQPVEALSALARAPGGGLGRSRERVLAATRFGGDVPAALASAADEPGAEGLRGLAACWRVAVDQGAGLATGLERVETALRAERDRRGDLRAGCAAARATALMLAGLPLAGLLFGWALGASPLTVLLHTAPGLGCLVTGTVLEGVGIWWALRIIRSAEE
ncbi:type II secretion system F family protein [Streptomyces sp. JNUCC 64]